MRHYIRKSLLLAVTILVALNALARPETKELQTRLDTPVSQYHLSASGMVNALAKVAERFELPMGIEWVNDKETLRTLNLPLTAKTVRAVLSSVVGRYPGYTWQVQNGVVHVFRRDLVNDAGNFLNLKVPNHFEAHEEPGGLVSRRLQFQVQNLISPGRLPPGAGVAGSYATGLQEKPLTRTLGGLTIREALDKLVETSEHKIWVATFSDRSGRTPTGFRRTETLWHPAPFQDRDQPMWDFLTWQEFERMSSPGGGA